MDSSVAENLYPKKWKSKHSINSAMWQNSPGNLNIIRGTQSSFFGEKKEGPSDDKVYFDDGGFVQLMLDLSDENNGTLHLTDEEGNKDIKIATGLIGEFVWAGCIVNGQQRPEKCIELL